MPVRRQIGTRDFATVPKYRFAGRVWVLDIVTLRDGNSEENSWDDRKPSRSTDLAHAQCVI